VTVRSDVPLAGAAVRPEGPEVPLERAADGRTFRGLVGIDLESATGRRALRTEVRDICGGLHSVRRELRIAAGRFRIQRLEVDPAFVEPPESELERIRSEHEKVARVWEGGERERRWNRSFRLPLRAPVRDNFGSRRVLNGEKRSPHLGVDLPASEGTPVVAPAPARVVLAEDLYFSGGTVILDHGAGLFTTYFHLSSIAVTVGDAMVTGETIGAVGATGRATGPHLHWGARLHSSRINPLALLRLPRWPTASSSD